ncbi:MAG TPA: homoserine dehydrogenase [Pyrinomonadaceae bacterium]|nr:homoserine dehydrogenase [Pyrinomonadaceae bacterium]
MSLENKMVVLKFGSSVLRSEKDLQTAVHEIYRYWRQGQQVIAVVSAFGNTTDELMSKAHKLCDKPEPGALAALLSTGEAASSAMLGIALNRVGIPACVLDAVQAGLRTDGSGLDTDLIAVDVARLTLKLKHSVVVLPGFVGRGQSGDISLLGRGGSDLTALFLAQRLGASCVLVKDVDGLYTSDPASTITRASRFTHVSYQTAARVGGAVVQLKAVTFAEAHRLRFSISSVGVGTETIVGPFNDALAVAESASEPLRVALLGCGNVGGGVYKRLEALPELFTIVGVGVRNIERARQEGVPDFLITSNLDDLIRKQSDVVVELLGGLEPASTLIELALALGRQVVTANKRLLAENVAIQHAADARVRYSAAVGGSLPALESIELAKRRGPLRAISGVLNGTSNFVLDQLATGVPFDQAVRVAQTLGYAELDPRFDLDGIDAAHKLILLAHAAFGQNLPLTAIQRQGIDQLEPATLKDAQEKGQTVRLVAKCRRVKDRLEASVAPVSLDANHPLASVDGVDNRLLIEPEVGVPCIVSGKGAGRWPTTEAIMADLLDVKRESRIEGTIEVREECVA